MISKMEAIQKLKKLGMQVSADDSVVTVLIPRNQSLHASLKEIRGKLNDIDYHSSFCVKYEAEEEGQLSLQDYCNWN